MWVFIISVLAMAFAAAWPLPSVGQEIAHGEGRLSVHAIADGRTPILAGARRICLSGFWMGGLDGKGVVPPGLRRVMEDRVLDQPLFRRMARRAAEDHYGCEIATVETEGGRPLQENLLRRRGTRAADRSLAGTKGRGTVRQAWDLTGHGTTPQVGCGG